MSLKWCAHRALNRARKQSGTSPGCKRGMLWPWKGCVVGFACVFPAKGHNWLGQEIDYQARKYAPEFY